MTQENRPMAVMERCLEVFRTRSGVSWRFFRGMHDTCKIEQELVRIVNSKEIDPATGDYKPLFEVRLVCEAHNASSVIERIQGQ